MDFSGLHPPGASGLSRPVGLEGKSIQFEDVRQIGAVDRR
jgi:hypothetical protein